MRRIVGSAAVLAIASVILFQCGRPDASGWKIVNRLSSGPSHGEDSGTLWASFLTETIGAAVGNGNYFFYTEDGGMNWRETWIGKDPCLGAPSMADAAVIALGCQWGAVKISADAGMSWTSTDLAGFPKVSIVDASTGLLAKNFALCAIGPGVQGSGEVARPKNTGRIIAISAAGASCFAVLDVNGILAVSEDAGRTWRNHGPIALEGRTLAFGDNYAAVQFTSALRGILVCFDSTAQEWLALSTEDGGGSWKTETLLSSAFGCCSISRDLKYVTIVPLSGDSRIIVLKNMRD